MDNSCLPIAAQAERLVWYVETESCFPTGDKAAKMDGHADKASR